MFLVLICVPSGYANVIGYAASDSWKLFNFQEFKSSVGDYFVADVDNGVGYLMNDSNKSFTTFPLLSGQKRNVCYIGRCYYAGTPKQKWVVKSEDIKGDKVTFSASGRFLRLYKEGEDRTSYGIHSHKYFQEMLDTGIRFKSMGCILVDDEVLDTIEKSYVANGKTLNVLTTGEVKLPVQYLADELKGLQ